MSRDRVRRCIVNGCLSTSEKASMCQWPRGRQTRQVWVELLSPHSSKLTSSLKHRDRIDRNFCVCKLHFEEKFFKGETRVPFSWPTLFTKEEILTRKPMVPVTVLLANSESRQQKRKKRKKEREWSKAYEMPPSTGLEDGGSSICAENLDHTSTIEPGVTLGDDAAAGAPPGPPLSAPDGAPPGPPLPVPDPSEGPVVTQEATSPTMWDVQACRVCLTVKGKLEKISNGCKRLYTAVTGLKIEHGDGYPHYFCLECRTTLKKCLAFRRKSRRAHFVMKEIMSVRKQVSYSEIITVNRKKTNLESSLGFWEPQKTHYIVITETEETKEELEPTGPYYTRVVDIKPENIVEESEPTPIEETNDVLEDTNDYNDANDAMSTKDELLDIDLNDVFKDLRDDDDINEAESPEPEEVEPVKEEVEDIMSQKISRMSVRTILQLLVLCDIKVLSLDAQKERMEIRKRRKAFADALYKCSMCLTIHNSMESLVEHVAYHNRRRFRYECAVCINKYPTFEDLNIHVTRCHMYEYTCKCGVIQYSLHDLVKHSRWCVYLNRKRKEEAARRERRCTKWRPLACFTVLSLTQRMMHHVRALRGPGEGEYLQPEKITKDHCKCDVCGKWLKNKEKMDKHLRAKHRYLYTCNYCKEVFTARLPAVKHGKTHREVEKPRSCEDCDACFKNGRKLAIHRLKHKTENTCNLCGQLFNSTRSYYKHQLTEHKYISLNDPLVGDPQYKCSDCGIQFINKRSLETHLVIMNHAGASDIELACLPCKKLFDDEDQLETHYITCKVVRYPRKCCYCPEMLEDKLQYQRHYNKQHPTLQYRYTGQNAICDVCGKSIHKPQLEAHRKLHAGNSFHCRLCGISHTEAASHITHILGHAAKPYLCALCPLRFQYKGEARDHILKVHAPTKLYKCEFCAQEFSYFWHLKVHSKKLHNLVITSKKNKFKRSKTEIFVYAHMKIEINEDEREAVEKTDVRLVDYLDEKTKPVDYKDYFVFTKDCDQMFRVKKKRRRTPKTEKLKVPKIDIESDIILKPAEENEEMQLTYVDENSAFKMDEVHLEYDEPTETENAVRRLVEDNDIIKTDVQGIVIDEEIPMEVFDNEGNQFVVLDGEVYSIAMDEGE